VDLKEHYDKISEAARLVRQDSLRDLAPLQAAHAVVDEIRLWQEILGARPEANIFDQIVNGLELGLFALVSGLYRQAYGSLRLAVELTAGVCWFSANRLDLVEWQSGERDLIWKEITNQDEGVLSARFRKAFFPELKEELKYNGLNKKLYRELSEYVHGHASTWAGAENVKYDEKLHQAWFEKLDTYMIVTSVLMSLRYLQEVGDEAVRRLAPNLRSRVGHISAITKYLDERLPAPVAAMPASIGASAVAPATPVAAAPASTGAAAAAPAAAGTQGSATSAPPETNDGQDTN
jgi:hypothetical protein